MTSGLCQVFYENLTCSISSWQAATWALRRSRISNGPMFNGRGEDYGMIFAVWRFLLKMTFKKSLFRFLALAALLLFGLTILLHTGIEAKAQDDEIIYITSRPELAKALADGQETIYVGDIDFDENDIYILIDKSVKFVGKTEGSVFRKGRFVVQGSDVESEFITVSFENIIFDGCYSQPSGNPEQATSFVDFHGERNDNGCFVVKGYLDLSLSDCTIKNYCSKYGAAMYLQYTNGNQDLSTRAKLFMKGCSFTGNISERGIFWCNGKNTKLEMSDCTFTENSAYTSVVVLGGIKGTVDGVTVKDNKRVSFKEKNSFVQGGGGIAIANSEAVVKNCVIDGNSAPNGGGVLVTNSKLTLANCRIINNTSDTFGGGIVIQSGESTPVYVTNCLISGNKAEEEGAVWVYPSDQIGVGVPTGIVEFSFCTFENNVSDDKEHLVFHPVMLENEEGIVGRDGKIDFIACRINDQNVTVSLKNGENYNMVNSDKTGAAIPPDELGKIANGYYKGTSVEMYPGVNLKLIDDGKTASSATESKSGSQNIIIAICAICFAVLAGVAFFILRAKDKRQKAETDPGTDIKENKENINSTEDIESVENKDTTLINNIGDGFSIEALAIEKSLTERETDVLREYLSGKNRTEISETLFISESTVKNHISNIFSKLGVKNKCELLKVCHK